MLERFFIVVSKITPSAVLFIVPILLYTKNKKRLLPYFLSLGISLGIVMTLKYLFYIPRPENALIEVTTPRFPSNHAAISFLLVGFFKKLKYRLPLLLFALISAYSRLYLHVHTLIDLVVGALIGFCVPYLVLLKEDRLRELFYSSSLEPGD